MTTPLNFQLGVQLQLVYPALLQYKLHVDVLLSAQLPLVLYSPSTVYVQVTPEPAMIFFISSLLRTSLMFLKLIFSVFIFFNL